MIQTDQRNRIHVYIEHMRIYKVRPLELNAYGVKFFRPLHPLLRHAQNHVVAL